MSIFLTALLTASLTMSAVILLLLLLNKLLATKVPVAFRYYMWLIVLIGLLVPFRPSLPVPFEPIQIPISFESADMSGAAGNHMQNEAQQILSVETPVISDAAPTAPASEKPAVSFTLILFGIWITGALTVLAFHLRSYGKFNCAVRRWGVQAEDRCVLSVFQAVQDNMGLNDNQIEVKTCAFVSSPMLIGFRSPAILLPEKAISPDELEHIFRHELTHYRHRDLWMNLFVLFVSAMHWFNPFIYLMAKTIRADCEAACDAAVVAGNDADKRKHYGETIIGFIGAKNAMTPVLSTYFYGGSNSMKKRLFSIMDTTRKRKGVAAVCAAAVILVTLLSGNVFAASAASSNVDQYIGEAKAKSIALEHAGISESQSTFVKAYLDYDDGRVVYDVEFYSGNTEYDYEIDAVSGNILEYDKDIEYYSIPVNSSAATDASKYIGEAKAKSIALEHAGISESQATFIKAHLDYDDRHVVYDIEFYSGNTEYDYKINAVSGDILEYDREIEYYTIPNDSTGRSGASGKSSQQTAANSTGQYIGEAKAKSIALSAAGLSESQVSRMKVKLEREDGKMVYEVEFDNGRTEYDYEIDAVSGTILKTDVDYDD